MRPDLARSRQPHTVSIRLAAIPPPTQSKPQPRSLSIVLRRFNGPL